MQHPREPAWCAKPHVPAVTGGRGAAAMRAFTLVGPSDLQQPCSRTKFRTRDPQPRSRRQINLGFHPTVEGSSQSANRARKVRQSQSGIVLGDLCHCRLCAAHAPFSSRVASRGNWRILGRRRVDTWPEARHVVTLEGASLASTQTRILAKRWFRYGIRCLGRHPSRCVPQAPARWRANRDLTWGLWRDRAA